jgi:CRP-like cAMP-binding protein
MPMNDQERALIGKFVQRLTIFKNLSDDNLEQIIDDFSPVTFSRGDSIFYQTDESTDLYLILQGSVRACLQNEEGQELVLTHFREGDFFGEMSLLDGRPRSATMVTQEETTLAVLKRNKFLNTLKTEPMIAIDMLSALVQRLRKADEMIESLAFLDVKERLVKYLLGIAASEGETGDDGTIKVKKLTHKELASRTGASREAITKVLKVLIFNKAIKDDGSYFHILKASR